MRFVVNKITSEDEAKALLRQPREKVALDVETVSIDNPLPLGVAAAISPDTAYYFFDPRDEMLGELIASTPVSVMHNSKFDIPILKAMGHRFNRYEDTMLMAWSSGHLENNLEALSMDILHEPCPSVKTQWRKTDSGNIAIDHVKMAEMSLIHAMNTYRLEEKLPKIDLYREVDLPCVELLMEMEHKGLLIDQHKLTEVEQDAVVKANKLEAELHSELGDINLASNPQCVIALQAKGILGTRKTKAGAVSVSEESLKPLNHPLANKLLDWRKEMKTLTTYVPAFRSPDIWGRIHTTFGLTNTGRWSSSDPNLQNISNNALRLAIVPPFGYTFLSLDASQIELRVVAILSQDPVMLQALSSLDLHLATAIQVFGWTDNVEDMARRRYNAKQLNFAILYGADAFKVAEMASISVVEAEELITQYFDTYKVLKQWIEARKKLAKERGYVTNFFGRIRPIPELSSGSWKIREKGEREAINTEVQGTAVDIVKKMMLYIRPELPFASLVLQVHDEILFEVPDVLIPIAINKARELDGAFPMYPVTIATGKRYGELKKVNGGSNG